MGRKRKIIPDLCRHEQKNTYYARFWRDDGTLYTRNFGPIREPGKTPQDLYEAAAAAFEREVARFLAVEKKRITRNPDPKPVIGQLVLKYLDYAKRVDRKPDGSSRGYYTRMRTAAEPLLHLYHALPIDQFGLEQLIKVRARIIETSGHWRAANPEQQRQYVAAYKRITRRRELGQEPGEELPAVEKIWIEPARRTVDGKISAIRTIFKKGRNWGLVSRETFADLQDLDTLEPGESSARETPEVPPVSIADFFATYNEAGPVIRAMMILQLSTGMRSGELVRVRKRNLRQKKNGVWEYEPESHKTQKFRKGKRIPVGADVIDEIRRLIDFDEADDDEFLFSPRASVILFHAARHENATVTRTTPPPRKLSPARKPGDRYESQSYGAAIRRAAKRAGVPPWHPHQLRHSAATLIDQNFGKEAAKVVLGHLNERTTDIYIDYNEPAADEVASNILRLILDHKRDK